MNATFSPPIVQFIQRGQYLYTYLTVAVGDGYELTFRSRIDLNKVEQKLRDGSSDVSGLFGSIFKGIKKAVKTVGKATGLNKVVKLAGKVLKNPLVQAIIPGASLASRGVDVAHDMVVAVAAKKAKHPAAKKALILAAAKAKKAGWDAPQMQKSASTIYKLIISPE